MSNPVDRSVNRRNRIIHLFKYLLEGSKVIPFVSLANKLDVSVDTLRRDLKLLESILCTEQKYFEIVHGKVYTYFQKGIAPLHEELQFFLIMALKQMEYFSDDKEGKRISAKIRSFISKSIDDEDEMRWNNIEDYIIISQFSKPLERTTFYQDIIQILKAIDQGHFVSAMKNVGERRYLDPFSLYYAKNTFYLIAEEYKFVREGNRRIPIQITQLRHFRLDRLVNLEIDNHATSKKKEVKRENAIRYINLMWEAEGPQVGVKDSLIEKPYKLQLDVLDKKVWKRIKERRWGARQTFIEGQGEICGTLIIDHVTSQLEVKKWVLGWGSSVKIIEPEWLREEIKEEVKKLLELY